MDKIKTSLVQDKLIEYAYRQSSGEQAPTFHKLLLVHADDAKAKILRAGLLEKGFHVIVVETLTDAKSRLLEDMEIELILCDLSLPDGTGLEFLHTIRDVSDKFKVKNPPLKLLPFFVLTENNDLMTEYQYRDEGVNDYFVSPINIPELIRRILFFID